MRHRKSNVKLGRTASHREAMLRNMATSLFEHQEIRTTLSKAKALRPLVDKLINLAKRGDLPARRFVHDTLRSDKVAKEVMSGAKLKFGDRQSGYVVIAKLGFRAGDRA
ncbi:MAG: 50S ribosomal protein L17, partial [Deltaproteobacteria bacterium]|nr:50S ribosomal protein L17 [Deltaproteobacteria bacterium]